MAEYTVVPLDSDGSTASDCKNLIPEDRVYSLVKGSFVDKDQKAILIPNMPLLRYLFIEPYRKREHS